METKQFACTTSTARLNTWLKENIKRLKHLEFKEIDVQWNDLGQDGSGLIEIEYALVAKTKKKKVVKVTAR
jgi:orotate phosphoribosyltransferase-like protein